MYAAAFLFALTLSVSAKTNSPQMTLDGSFLKAIERSYTLANQTELLNQAEESYLQAWQGFMPTLSATGSEVLGGYSDPVYGNTNIGSLKLALSQPLFRGFRNIALLEQSKSLIQSKKEAKLWAYHQLYLDTAQTYYGLLTVNKQLLHLSNQVKLYDERIREVSAWVKIGRSRGSDLSSIKAARALSYAQMVQVQGQLSNSVELFRFITGAGDFTIADSVTDFSPRVEALDSYIASAEARPDLKAAKAQNISVRKAVEIAQSDRLPWVDFTLTTGNNQLWKNAPYYWNVQLTLTYSLFADTFVQSKIRTAQSQAAQSDSAYLYLQDTIRRDIRTSYSTLLSYIGQIQTYREAVGYLKDNYEQLERDYRLSAAKITDVLSALTSYEDAVRALDTLLYSANIEWVRLQVYSGQLNLPEEARL